MPGFHAKMEQGLNCYKVFRGLEPPGRGGLGPDLLMVCAHAWSLLAYRYLAMNVPSRRASSQRRVRDLNG